MTDELRSRLEKAAGPSPAPLDFGRVVARARRQTLIRATTTIAAVVGAVVLAGSLATSGQPRPPSIVDQPPPGPAPSTAPTASETGDRTSGPTGAAPPSSECEESTGDFVRIDQAAPTQPEEADLEFVRISRTRSGDVGVSWQNVTPPPLPKDDEETATLVARYPGTFQLDLHLRSVDAPGTTGHVRYVVTEPTADEPDGVWLDAGPSSDELRRTAQNPLLEPDWWSGRFVLQYDLLEVLDGPFEWAATWRFPEHNTIDACPDGADPADPLAADDLPVLPAKTEAATASTEHDLPAGLVLRDTIIQKLPATPEPTWYSAGAVVTNQTEDAMVIAATLTPHHQDGRTGSPLEVDGVTILPGEDGLLFAGPEDIGLDLDYTGTLRVDAEVVERIPDPAVPDVAADGVEYATGADEQCLTSGELANGSGVDLSDLEVAMLGYVDGELRAAAAQAGPDLPAGGRDTFSLPMSGPSACPDELDDVRVILDLPPDALAAGS